MTVKNFCKIIFFNIQLFQFKGFFFSFLTVLDLFSLLLYKNQIAIYKSFIAIYFNQKWREKKVLYTKKILFFNRKNSTWQLKIRKIEGFYGYLRLPYNILYYFLYYNTQKYILSRLLRLTLFIYIYSQLTADTIIWIYFRK